MKEENKYFALEHTHFLQVKIASGFGDMNKLDNLASNRFLMDIF